MGHTTEDIIIRRPPVDHGIQASQGDRLMKRIYVDLDNGTLDILDSINPDRSVAIQDLAAKVTSEPVSPPSAGEGITIFPRMLQVVAGLMKDHPKLTVDMV